MKSNLWRKLLTFLLALGLAFLSVQLATAQNFSATSGSQGWEIKSTVQLTSDGQFDLQPCMIQDSAGRLLVFFTSYAAGTYNIRFITSNDGSAWSNPEPITSETSSLYGSLSPSAIQDQRGAYWLASYRDSSGIFTTRSANGTNWNTPTQVTFYDYKDHSWCRSPSLMQDKTGKYWMAYESSINRADIIIRSSYDGFNWGTPYQVTPGTDDERAPCIIQDSKGSYWVVWFRQDGAIWASNSKDGLTWSPPKQIETGMTSFFPRIIQNNSGGYVLTWVDSAVAGQGNVWITRSMDFATWQPVQKLIRGISFYNLMQGTDGKIRLTFSSDLKGNNDIWSMTLAQGAASPAWPPAPTGGFSVRFTNITAVANSPAMGISGETAGNLVNVTWAAINTTGWSGHKIDFGLWICQNFTVGAKNSWLLIAQWDVGFVGTGGSFSSLHSTNGTIIQYGSPFGSQIKTHPVDGTWSYWLWGSTVIANISQFLRPSTVMEFAAEVDHAPTAYNGNLPYYGETGTGEYCRIINITVTNSTTTPTPSPSPSPSPTTSPTSSAKPITSPSPTPSPTPTPKPSSPPSSPSPTPKLSTSPNQTAAPTPTPVPTETEEPKNTPTPTNSRTPSPDETTPPTRSPSASQTSILKANLPAPVYFAASGVTIFSCSAASAVAIAAVFPALRKVKRGKARTRSAHKKPRI